MSHCVLWLTISPKFEQLFLRRLSLHGDLTLVWPHFSVTSLWWDLTLVWPHFSVTSYLIYWPLLGCHFATLPQIPVNFSHADYRRWEWNNKHLQSNRVSRTGPMPFCWPCCSLLFCLQLFSLSLLFLYRLVVWGWGLRTDRYSISLSRPCIANLFK